MTTRTKEQGFTLVEAALIIVVLAIVGLVGWRFWATTHPATTASTASATAGTKPITSAADLKQTDSDLQNLDVDDGTLSSLNTQTSY